MARDQSKLHPILQYKIKQIVALCAAQGLKIGIGECVRTVAEQDYLYSIGRTLPGIKVTNCKGSTYSSMHQFGVAFDFYRDDGKGAYNTSNKFFERVGAIGQSIGLEWGGAWKKTNIDRPHFQLPYWGSTPGLIKTKYGTFENFKNTAWNLSQPMATVKAGSSINDVLWVQIHLCMLTKIRLDLDGIWGPKTEQAVINYQKMLGWNATGKAGEKTINALANYRVK